MGRCRGGWEMGRCRGVLGNRAVPGAGGESVDETEQPGCRGGHDLRPGGVNISDSYDRVHSQ